MTYIDILIAVLTLSLAGLALWVVVLYDMS